MTFGRHQPGQELPRWPWILASCVGAGRREGSSSESPPLAWFLCPEAWAEARLAVALSKSWHPNLRPCPAMPPDSCPHCPRGKASLPSPGMASWKASSSQSEAWTLPQHHAHLVPSPAVPLTCYVTLGKPLPLSKPPFPPLRGANISSWSGRCDDSESLGVGSLVCQGQGGPAKSATEPIAANVSSGRCWPARRL